MTRKIRVRVLCSIAQYALIVGLVFVLGGIYITTDGYAYGWLYH